ncbi:O-acyltransferase like protein-like [Ischnura elegans]|uniref:O-acyltransferase like protein-like n=1 Tax=Ischnura elegans TaxID=197161 RepID=UPI001ED89748|nr:O-acyltransferase like protein-like [Ischnura elegans]
MLVKTVLVVLPLLLGPSYGTVPTPKTNHSQPTSPPGQRRLDQLLDFFESRKLEEALAWSGVSPILNSRCKKEMGLYLKGLRDGHSWADKMFDSTGRYSSLFLFGNDYFLGSQSLCMELGRNVSTPDPLEDDSRRVGGPWRGPPSFLRWRANPPPFNLSFHVITLRVALPPHRFQGNPREVRWGLCLPEGCSQDDSAIMARLMAERGRERGAAPTSAAVRVISSKRVPGNYSLWSDTIFHVMVTATCLVLFLTLIGTTLDALWPVEGMRTATVVGGTKRVGFLDPQGETDGHADNNAGRRVAAVVGGFGYGCCSGRSPFESCLSSYLRCFSLPRNARMVLRGSRVVMPLGQGGEAGQKDTESGPRHKPLECLHGLRFFSLLWVILSHTYYLAFLYCDNKHYRGVVERDFLFQTIGNGPFAVDTFFFISGLLVSFLYFRSAAAALEAYTITPTTTQTTLAPPLRKRAKQYLRLVAYRVIRLTPAYLFVIGVVELTMKSFRSESVFEPPTDDDFNCPDFWWRNLFFVNTLYPVKEMCMIWSWYLADDTQFFIIGLFIVMLGSSHFKWAAFVGGTVLLTSWLTTAFIVLDYDYMPRISEPLALFDELYDKPWTRIGPHIIGLFAGWFLYTTDCKLNLRRHYLLLGWLFSASLCSVVVYGLYCQISDAMVSASYAALSHTAWAVALLWLVTACAAGKGGWINSFLSCKIWAPFSRLTYCAYLLHPVVIRATVAHTDSPLHISRDTFAFLFIGHACASYFLAFILSVTLEAPIISLLKLSLFPKRLNLV